MPSAPFISWVGHGAASLAPPAVFTGVKAHLFATPASTAAMQKLADTLLNPAGAGTVRYTAVLPLALLSFMDMARCTSAVDQLGWLPGRESAIWVPLLEEHPGNLLATRLVFWAPYIFIDYTIGMVTGREVWGWPKVGGKIDMPGDPADDPTFTCRTMIFPTLAPTTQGQRAPLYRVVPKAEPGQPSPATWSNGTEAVEALLSGLFGEIASEILDALRVRPVLPCVALKQFRDAAVASETCFQAIVDSPAQITQFHGGGLSASRYELHVTTCESHQIVFDLLGRKPDTGSTTLPITFAAWLAIDLEALPGRNIAIP